MWQAEVVFMTVRETVLTWTFHVDFVFVPFKEAATVARKTTVVIRHHGLPFRRPQVTRFTELFAA